MSVGLTVVVSFIVLLWVSQAPQGLYNDPTYQLKALQQHIGGQSTSFNVLVKPSPTDLSRDVGEWVSIWPPGMGLLLYPAATHMKLAAAVRTLASLSYVVGCVGWVYWIGLFQLPRRLSLLLAAALPLMHYATTPLLQYYTESLAWASVPWALFAAAKLRQTTADARTAQLLLRSALLGAGLGLLYWLKYSTIFVSFGILAFLGVTVLRKASQRHFAVLLMTSSFFLAIAAALTVWNKLMGAPANYVAATRGWFFEWSNVFQVVGFFPLAIADAEGLLRWLLLSPGHPFLHDAAAIPLAMFPVGLALAWLVFRRRNADYPVQLGRAVAVVSALGILSVWTISKGGATHEGRHIASAAIALLPIAVQEGLLLTRRTLRLVGAAAAFVFIVIPLLYGGASVVGKTLRTKGYRPGASGFYNPLLAKSDLAAVVAELRRYDSADTVWYVTDGATALDVPGRTIIRTADFLSFDELRKETYRSSVPIRINLLLPAFFEKNGKSGVIVSSFPQAREWRTVAIPGAERTLWTAILSPEPK